MARIKTIDELIALRDKLKQDINTRSAGETETNIKVIVGMATCGIAAGARQTLTAMIDEASKLGLSNVTFVQSGCMGSCHAEPTVEIRESGKDPILYGNVTEEKAREIVLKHIKSGELVQNLIIGKPFERV